MSTTTKGRLFRLRPTMLTPVARQAGVAIETLAGDWVGRTIGLVFVPRQMFEGSKPGVARSLGGFVANCVVAYLFAMFMLLFDVGDEWHRSFNGVKLTEIQIFSTVSWLLLIFFALNLAATVICTTLSWAVYRVCGARGTMRRHFASLLDLSFVEFIAAAFFVNSVLASLGNRPDFVHNQWFFNLGVGSFVVTRIWYLAVAIYAMRAVHILPTRHRWVLFVAGFCPVFLVVNVWFVCRWWLSIADAVMVQHRVAALASLFAR